MTERLSRLFSLFMACTLLVSTTGLSFGVHYCQGQFSGISITGSTKSCNDQSGSQGCKKKSEDYRAVQINSEGEENCCQNQQITIEGDDSEKLAHASLVDNLSTHFLYASIENPIFSEKITVSENSNFQNYRPPPLIENIQVLYQVYLL